VTDESVLKKATGILVRRFQPQRVILFGSQATGTADSHSDVDLLVICPVEGNRHTLWMAMDETLNGLQLATDVVIMTPREFDRDRRIPGTVARSASREGRVLYASS